MIYTVTFNPSLDYIVRADHFAVGEVNRTTYEQILEGGKGLNVSVVLKNMGLDSVALGFTAGFTGEEIERRVAERGVSADFVRVEEGMSRINVKLKAEVETELNGQGPHIEKRHIEKLYEKLEQLKKGDILLNGHTHIPANQDMADFIYMNPGSVSIPKENSAHGYMIYDQEFIWKDLDGNVIDML